LDSIGFFSVSLTRRQFLWTAAASAVASPLLLHAQSAPRGSAGLFRHGVASGDPLADRVILWTRVSPAGQPAGVDVRWRVATDERLMQVVASGTFRTSAARDYTVKVDAAGLQPGRPYFYAFDAGTDRSPVGRTRTIAAAPERARFAVVSCANYPSGYFNAYRNIAGRTDLDAVLHLGDYIYEFENGIFGDGTKLLRVPEPRKEAATLGDYRIRYATYRTDPDLQEIHRLHPFIVVWDDHELTNDAWRSGAGNHNPESGEGDWATRKAAAYRAYQEWMPIREQAGGDVLLYRRFQFGTLLDLVMLDTRGLRDQQVATANMPVITSATRTMLGAAQERWLFDQLRASSRAGASWRVIGQQVLFSRLVPPGTQIMLPDAWDGYQAARDRLLDVLSSERIRDVAILGGDFHSSWAFDVPRNPWSGYQARTGEGSLAVEMLAPAVSSPPLFADPATRQQGPALRALLPHLKLLEGEANGYLVVDITRQRLLGEWFMTPTVLERTPNERRIAAFACERGSSRLATA
jgi:alkaline phosphatase D